MNYLLGLFDKLFVIEILKFFFKIFKGLLGFIIVICYGYFK